MSGRITINRVTNANVYANGNCLLGRVEEIKLPDVSVTFTEHKTLGMISKIELPSGFEKLEGEMKWNSYYEDTLAMAADPFSIIQLQCRSSLDTYDSSGRSAQRALVTFLSVAFKKTSLGTYKQNDNAEYPSNFACYYIKQQLDGKDVLELDTLANIYKINGKDMLDLYRKNLGA